MYREWLLDDKFYLVLERIDADLASTARVAGCLVCNGVLHSARYPRKPRGGPSDLGGGYDWRASLCCAKDRCRKRTTPKSVRFLGRKVYLGAVVVVATVLRHGVTKVRMERLRALFGVSAKTVKRWRAFWQQSVAASGFWKLAKGRFVPEVATNALPMSLLARFDGAALQALAHFLRFISPITTQSASRTAPVFEGQ
jgi:hypothetical protein